MYHIISICSWLCFTKGIDFTLTTLPTLQLQRLELYPSFLQAVLTALVISFIRLYCCCCEHSSSGFHKWAFLDRPFFIITSACCSTFFFNSSTCCSKCLLLAISDYKLSSREHFLERSCLFTSVSPAGSCQLELFHFAIHKLQFFVPKVANSFPILHTFELNVTQIVALASRGIELSANALLITLSIKIWWSFKFSDITWAATYI